MKAKIFATLLAIGGFAAVASAQTSWLDRPLTTNWNRGDGIVPTAPRPGASLPGSGDCASQVRNPESIADRAVTRAGWSLFGPAQVYGPVTVVTAMASVDGMCRPNQYNGFVFVANRFAGSLAPSPTNARTDGALGRIGLVSPSQITAEFARYTSSDPLCCPSQTSHVAYSISTGTRAAVKAEDISTAPACPDGSGTEDNVVSGTVTYRQRIALPQTAVLTVRIFSAPQAGLPIETIAEQRIETAGKQVPFNFEVAYDRRRIDQAKTYSVRAEITDGTRLLYVNEMNYPVITGGNPRNVDIVVQPVGGGGRIPGQGSGTIRGTVTYLQRIALGPSSQVTVRLVESADPMGTPVAETLVMTNGRQVPIPFELRYEARDIDRQRNYELRAEIRTDGRLRFRSQQGQAVNLRGAPPADVQIVVAAASDEPEVVTGQSLSLAKFGTGNFQIEGRGSELIIRGNVAVRTDGTATVSITRLSGTITFTGKLMYFDENVLRITVESSGNADASGEIEVRYSGRNLNAMLGNNLVLDGQRVELRF